MSERRYAGSIERLRHPDRLALLEVDKVLEHCLEASIRRVLDVGTGSGIFAEAFVARGLEVSGLDIAEAMLEAAQAYVPQAHFLLGSIEQLPFDDASMDMVFMGHVLHESDDIVQSLREAARVASQRIAVLEWPYQDEERGPPLDHRLEPERVQDALSQAQLPQARSIAMEHMALYIIDL